MNVFKMFGQHKRNQPKERGCRQSGRGGNEKSSMDA